MNKYAKFYNIDRTIVDFDIFQFSLALFRPNCKIYAEMFTAYFRLPKKTLHQKLRYFLTYLLTYLVSKNLAVEKILALNDNKAVGFLNRHFGSGELFQFIPDPVPKITTLPDFHIRREYGIEPNRKVFLIFGSLRPDKGINNVLASIPYINAGVQAEMCILLAGQCKIEYKSCLESGIACCLAKNSIQIILDDNFISIEKMWPLFEQCDVVLLLNRAVNQSSGVLGQAAICGKPIVGRNAGLIGELIQNNNLGITFDGTPQNLAYCLEQVMRNNFSAEKNEYYINTSKPEQFAAEFLNP
jgi:glycosyltransferase involved in cell wall biosynthesis